jgi:hypothetical protein
MSLAASAKWAALAAESGNIIAARRLGQAPAHCPFSSVDLCHNQTEYKEEAPIKIGQGGSPGIGNPRII